MLFVVDPTGYESEITIDTILVAKKPEVVTPYLELYSLTFDDEEIGTLVRHRPMKRRDIGKRMATLRRHRHSDNGENLTRWEGEYVGFLEGETGVLVYHTIDAGNPQLPDGTWIRTPDTVDKRIKTL